LSATAGNCCRTVHSGRVAWLIDGERYFAALEQALRAARSQVWILAWDLDTRIQLCRPAHDGKPVTLGDLLLSRKRSVPNLRIHVLNWDAAAVYSLGREWFPGLRLGGWRDDAVQYARDGYHATGAAHHQKVVVVDDAIAFCGGMDLTARRWDASEHAPDDSRRMTPDGDAYPPRHDVQLLVDGETAGALGDLARARWLTTTGEDVPPPAELPADHDPWPESVAPAIEDVDICIARTVGAYREVRRVREIEALYVDCIEHAQSYLYIENQYFTSRAVCAALERRLADADSPEIVLVLPQCASGWLEEATIGALRAGCLTRLKAADGADRLRILYPQVDTEGGEQLVVHSKLMAGDDRWLRIGSANLSNRSMRLDTECDLLVRAASETHREGVHRLVCELLGEHTGVGAEDFARRWDESGGLIPAIEGCAAGTGPRRLVDLRVPAEETAVVDAALLKNSVDPEGDVLEQIAVGDAPVARPWHGNSAKIRFAVVLAVVLLLAAAWSFTPAGDWLTAANLTAAKAALVTAGPPPLVAAAGFLLGSLVAVPVTMMVALTAWLYGPWLGLFCSLLGITLSASVNFGLGSLVGRNAMVAIAGSFVDRVARQVARQGILAVATLRMLPIAPYTVVNLVAGASQVRFADYLVGTLLGMAPGVAALGFVISGTQRLLLEDRLIGIGLLIGGLGLAGAMLLAVRVARRLRLLQPRSCES